MQPFLPYNPVCFLFRGLLPFRRMGSARTSEIDEVKELGRREKDFKLIVYGGSIDRKTEVGFQGLEE